MISSSVAHPRSRGEHWRDQVAEVQFTGSSPLARGTHVAVHGATVIGGLIPAHAGNTVP